VEDWESHRERARRRYADGETRLPDDPDARQRQLTRMGNAAAAAGLASLMAGEREVAAGWLARAADRYRESWPDAPAGSWGRPIGAMKARVLAGDWDAAAADARWALDAGAGQADGPIGRYAAALAAAVLEDWAAVRLHADAIRTRDDFPAAVADALVALAAEDVAGYTAAVGAVLESFEARDDFLEDLPVADTVMVLQALAVRRGMAAELRSELLPSR
jgi:hypothetical protein